MFAEYWRGYSECDAKQSFRMTVMLFDAFDPDDYEDAEAAWQTTRCDQECRTQEYRAHLYCALSAADLACLHKVFVTLQICLCGRLCLGIALIMTPAHIANHHMNIASMPVCATMTHSGRGFTTARCMVSDSKRSLLKRNKMKS